MVRTGAGRWGREFFSQLEQDPFIETTAVALKYGAADPIAFLDKRGLEWEIQCAVVRKTQEMADEEKLTEIKALVKGISEGTGNRVAIALARILRNMFSP